MKTVYVCNVKSDDNVLPPPVMNFGLIPDPRLNKGNKPAKEKQKRGNDEREDTLDLPVMNFGEADSE